MTVFDEDYVAKLRRNIGDTGSVQAFEDDELDDYLLEALRDHDNQMQPTLVPVEDKDALMLLATANICRTIALDQAKYYDLTQEGLGINKAMRMAQYLEMSNTFKRDYLELCSVNGLGRTYPKYIVVEDVRTGALVPRTLQKPIDKVEILLVEAVEGVVHLIWTQCQHQRFGYYAFLVDGVKAKVEVRAGLEDSDSVRHIYKLAQGFRTEAWINDLESGEHTVCVVVHSLDGAYVRSDTKTVTV